MTYLELIREFLKIGLFAIGGGLASLPFLYDISARTGWYSAEDIINMIAISESTPGPIGINMATYVGYLTGGLLGGMVATLAVIAPSVVIIILIARILNKFMENEWVKAAFYGLRPAVAALIVSAFLEVVKVALFNTDLYKETHIFRDLLDWKGIILFTILYYLIRKGKKHPIVYIASSAVIGILLKMA